MIFSELSAGQKKTLRQAILAEANMQFDKSKIEALFHKDWSLIGIVFYGRGGSFFLQSILDGHPQILALPPYINNMYNVVYDKKSNTFREEFPASDLAGIFEPVMQKCVWNVVENPVTSGPAKFFGENKDIFFEYDYDTFLNIFKDVIAVATLGDTVRRKDVYLGLFFAYNIMAGKSLDDLLQARYLMCQLHTPMVGELKTVKKDFDNLIYLVSGREPVSGLISHIQAYNDMLKFNYFNEGAYNWCVPIALDEVLNGAVVHDFLDKKQCRVVKNEYLHRYQDKYAKSLLDYLGLPWADICAKSTFDSQIFWWKFGEEARTGYNGNYKWKICDKANASCRDKRFFSALLKDRYEAWNYAGCPNAELDMDWFRKEGFDFFETLHLSEHIRNSFTKSILDYYNNSYGRAKEYIPALECSEYEQEQVLDCTFSR